MGARRAHPQPDAFGAGLLFRVGRAHAGHGGAQL
eukprot:gene58842-80591_t